MKKTAEEIINESIEKRRKKEEEKKKLVEETKNDEIEPSIEPQIADINEEVLETDNDRFVRESKSFLWYMLKSGRSRMTQEEARRLEEIYNRTLGLAEKIGNCDLCSIRMWKRMCNYYGVK